MSSDQNNASGQTAAAQPQPGDAAAFRRLGLEAGPLVVFFVVNQFWDIFSATAAFMVVTVIAVALSLKLERRVPLMPLVSSFFVLLFGGLTLALEDDLFIKIKPTVVNLLFAAILFVSLALRRHILKVLLGTMMVMSDQGWRVLAWRWACFFVFLALVNEVVWRNFSTEFWAGFKLFGIMPMTLIFAAAQVPLLMREQSRAAGPAE